MTKKLISFSLWGQHEFYNYGALENALLAQELFPGWLCRFYFSNADPVVLKELRKLPNVELVEKANASETPNNMFWRFEPAFDREQGVDVVLSRDTDSRLSLREKAAVEEWLSSSFDFHIMRDHPNHTHVILGGMWGCRKGILWPLKPVLDAHQKDGDYGGDQRFLASVVYPAVKDKSMIHASHAKHEGDRCLPFPVPATLPGDYVGSYRRTSSKKGRTLLKTVDPWQAHRSPDVES